MFNKQVETKSIHHKEFFELKFLLVIIRKTFRSPSFIAASLFSIVLYVGFPLVLLEAFEEFMQPNRILYFRGLDLEDMTQDVTNTLYGSIYVQIQIWSSLVRPIAIIAPTAILINKLIVQPYRSGQILIYVGTPIRKGSMLGTSLGLALVITMLLITIMEVLNIELSLQLFKSKLSSESIDKNFNLEEIIRRITNLEGSEELSEYLLSTTSSGGINAASIIEYNNQVNTLIPGMLEYITTISRSYLPYSIGMLLFYGFLSMPISFLIAFKSNSRFSSLYSMLIVSASAILYWGLVIPLSRLSLNEDVLLSLFKSMSYILIGIYPAYITIGAFKLGGYNVSHVLRFSIINRSEFDIVQKKVFSHNIDNVIADGTYNQEADIYLPTSHMLGIIGGLLFILLLLSTWMWKRSDIK